MKTVRRHRPITAFLDRRIGRQAGRQAYYSTIKIASDNDSNISWLLDQLRAKVDLKV